MAVMVTTTSYGRNDNGTVVVIGWMYLTGMSLIGGSVFWQAILVRLGMPRRPATSMLTVMTIFYGST